MMEKETLLSVKNLSIRLGDERNGKLVVEDANFEILRDEVVCLIGESGCGKSHTCLSLMGLLPEGISAAGGRIEFAGRNLLALGKKEMRALRGDRLTMILQNPMSCFDQVFTIARHFRETLAAHGIGKRREADSLAAETLAKVGFERPKEILELYPFQMSGGMLQRVMVALAILKQVALLIADEPTTDLDLVSQGKILDLLMGIREKEGIAMLLVTHDLGVVARCADRVAVMRRGRTVAWAGVNEIFARGNEAYTDSLVDAHLALYDRRAGGHAPAKEAS
jgi:nickel transport system ATP-binding protein